MRHFDDRWPSWAGLALGAIGVLAMPYSVIMGMRTAAGPVARIAVLLFHAAAVGSYLYFAVTSGLWT